MADGSLTLYHDQALMPTTFDGLLQQAEVLVKSGMLPAEVKTAAAAVAIMLKGRELNIPPMQAFSSIYVVKGKPTVSAQLMGALILRAGHSYHVESLTDQEAVITFQRKAGKPYTHSFTLKDADKAGLLNSETWRKYPKAMLFSRCMSAGARIAMPDVIAGMYTPEELADPGTLVVDDSGEVIDVMPRVPAPATAPAPESPAQPETPPAEPRKDKPTRPYAPETVKEAIARRVQKAASGRAASANQQQLATRALDALFPQDKSESQTIKRHTIMRYLVGKDSTKVLTDAEASALIAWAILGDNSENHYAAHPDAVQEAAKIVELVDQANGQQPLM